MHFQIVRENLHQPPVNLIIIGARANNFDHFLRIDPEMKAQKTIETSCEVSLIRLRQSAPKMLANLGNKPRQMKESATMRQIGGRKVEKSFPCRSGLDHFHDVVQADRPLSCKVFANRS